MTRLLWALAILLIIFASTRALIRALPGDPLETLITESGTTLSVEELRADLGLDRPFLPALAHDLSRAIQGDFGISLLSREPVAPLISKRLIKTFELTSLALVLTLLISIPLGLAAATKPRGFWDRVCDFHGALTAALPTPWLGPILLILFAVKFPIFPAGQSVALPALTLALSFSGLWARLIRERVRDTLVRGSADGARARGLPEWKVLLKYGLAPTSGSLLAYLGTQWGVLLAGAFVTEVLFDWPGMGSLLVESVLKRDYPIVESATFVAAAASFFGTWAGDWAQSFVDPRLRPGTQTVAAGK
ncbi:ABC transporter permease [Bdellovibrionota bacterium FG-1]